MKKRPAPLRFVARPTAIHCSVMLLSALGVLTCNGSAWGQSRALPPGTLPVVRGVVSGQAIVNSPVAGATTRLMTVDQSSPRAIIDWKSFDIGSGAEVRFNQPGATSSTLNRIYDSVPSVIQGKITSNGQVLLINQNGILFDRGAQINVQSLVASTLNISNDRYKSGALTTGGLTSPAFEGSYDINGDGSTLPATPTGAVLIGTSGNATAAAPQLIAKAGGSIMIFAPRIENKDSLITAPDGQVILAAGAKAYLALPDAGDITLRGFQVEVAATGGDVNLSDLIRSSGAISADRGNVTLAALMINQSGRVSASTAIQANGSVFLRARTLGGAQAGTLTLGAGSTTEVRPDASDQTTLPEGQSYLSRRGEVRAEGRTIVNSGTLIAPGGKITLTANDAADPTGARVYLDAGSATSVAGNWADVAYADNLLTFKVTSTELKNSPDQKTGVLKGATVTVDLRKDSTLFDLSGYQSAQSRNVGQKTAVGGAIAIESTGSVVQRHDAVIDASGGGYRYDGGTARTSLLLGDDGKTYDIATAPEQRRYTTLLDTFTKTYDRWGQTEVFTGLTLGLGKSEAGYVEGKPGGTIDIISKAGLVLDGELRGGVTVGPNQLAKAPRGAALTIGSFDTQTGQFDTRQLVGDVTIAQRAAPTFAAGFGPTTALTDEQARTLTLTAGQLYGAPLAGDRNVFQQTAFDSVEINSNGRITVAEGADIKGAPGSTLLMRAPQIEVAGSVSMAAGTIALQPVATLAPIDPSKGPDNNRVVVRSQASLSTAGVWVNNASADGSFVGTPLPTARLNTDVDGQALLNADGKPSTSSTLNGGNLTITASTLERGALLDVGGGAALTRGPRVTAGNGGTLTISNGAPLASSSDWLQADLSGFAVGNGSKLVINTPRALLDSADANGTLPANTTRLQPGLFSDFGFSNVAINTFQGIDIAADTSIHLQQRNRVVDPLSAGSLATGGDLRSVTRVDLLADDLRRPVGLSLSTSGVAAYQGQAKLTMGQGAEIVADPKATVAFSAVDGLRVDGRIDAPGGAVSLNLQAPEAPAPGYTSTLSLGSSATVSVAGTFVRKPNDAGLVQGTVVGGGSVTIGATGAGVGIDLAAGSLIDVHGISQVVQSLGADAKSPVIGQRIDGNAGALIVRSQGATRLDGLLSARAAAPQAAGGSFALELTGPTPVLGQTPPERRIVVVQQSPSIASAADPAFVDTTVSVNALQSAGFDKLRLQSENRIELRGNVDAAFTRGIRLDAPLLDVTGDGRANLQAVAVAIGQSKDATGQAGGHSTPPLPSRTGSALLSVQTGTLDLFGSTTVSGVGELRFFSEGDIRLTGRAVPFPDPGTALSAFGLQVGSLTTTGNLLLNAAQVYPTTRSDFTLAVAEQPGGAARTGGSVTIASNGRAAADAYSAGGRIVVVADTIVQGGVVKAPLGEIDLRAGSSLELGPGSVTSVSSKGLTVPYGFTVSGLSWRYQENPNGGSASPLTPQDADKKRIELSGKKVDVKQGATVDLSGGGEVQAVEFVPGIGGSNDTLIQPNTYAIIPKSKLTSMPVDTDTATALGAARDLGFGFQTTRYDTGVYDSLHIGPGAVVPEGDYVLLPGRYALLPDAFLVQLQTGSAYSNLAAGPVPSLINGQTVVAGYRTTAGTAVRESGTVGVVVRPGTAATRESDYTVTTSSYFTDLAASNRLSAPRVPVDAGRLVVANADSLSLAGRVDTAPGKLSTSTGDTLGRAAEVDISAERIAVVDRVGAPNIDAGFLQIAGSDLSTLGGSLLLGGQRSLTGDAMQITVGAKQIVVANSAAGALKAPELMLAATDTIDVRSGAVLTARGAAPSAAETTLKLDGDGALLRLSSGAQAVVDRGATVTNSQGELRIAPGAVLSTDRSLLLDATRSTSSAGVFTVAKGGNVSLASSRISLGQTAGVAGLPDGLALSNSDLASFTDIDALRLKSYQGFDFIGNAVLGSAALGSLTLDGGALRNASAAGSSTVTAKEVRLTNTSVGAVPNAAAAAGALAIAADRIVVGAGDQTITGFSAVTMTANREIVAQDSGSLAVTGAWTLRTPKVGVAAGAQQSWRAADLQAGATPQNSTLTLDKLAGAAGTSTDTDAGGRLALEGGRVSIATTVQARSGSIAVKASGNQAADGVTLASGALLDASGLSRDFRGRIVTADAGKVSLSASAGSVAVETGATIDVSADAKGGNAGSLAVAAGQGLDLGGALRATAGAGATGGRASLDLGQLTDFSAMNTALASGGFSEAIDLRLRAGDVLVASTDTVKAHAVQLAADAGRIDVSGQIDASSARGAGSVALWAANGLALAGGSRVSAAGTSTDAALASNGGRVSLSTQGGSLDFNPSSTIDVSSGAKGDAGNVTFGVARASGSNALGSTQLAGQVLGHTGSAGAEVVLEATRSYTATSSTVSAANITSFANEHAALVNGSDATARLAGLKGENAAPANASVRESTELRADGNLNIATAWDLTNAQWRAGGKAGTLTVRSGDTLTLSNSLGSPNDNIIDGQTWNLRVIGGADLTAANPMATKAADAGGAGSVVFAGNNAKVRTGTGSIEIAAATDFKMDSARSVVYTAGRIGAADTVTNGNNRWARAGGSITISAGRDAIGASDEYITEWLRRPRSNTTSTPAEWWAYRPNFQQGIGTLAGGDITITAGHDVTQLSAMLPTTGRSSLGTDGVRRLDVQGSGNLQVSAGNDVDGGSYLIGRGDGKINAGGNVGAATPVQWFLMGESSGVVPAHAQAAVAAGGSIAIQSVNNPTALRQLITTPGTGPSFGGGPSSAVTYFTYSDDSALKLLSKSGDVRVGGRMADTRGLASGGALVSDSTDNGAFPANLTAGALGGDIALIGTSADRQITTFPSTTAEVLLLAQGSLFDPNIEASGTQASGLPSVASPVTRGPAVSLSGGALQTGTAGGISLRPAYDGFRFDFQALTGDVTSSNANAAKITLPAVGRIRAGRDISKLQLQLQNLDAGDTSEVRADSGDVLPQGIEIRGPGTLLLQAGRDIDLGAAANVKSGIDLGGLIATGNNANANLLSSDAAAITLIAGVKGDVDRSLFKSTYETLVALNTSGEQIFAFYRALNGDPDRAAVMTAGSVADLVTRDKAYAPYQKLLTDYPAVLKAYQTVAKNNSLPLGTSPEATQANALYALLNSETDTARIVAAKSVADLVQGSAGGSAYAAYASLDKLYPRVFADYRTRRSHSAKPEGLTPIVFSDVLAEVTAKVLPPGAIGTGNIYTFQSSIQTYGNGSQPDPKACQDQQCRNPGDIDLWAPGGSIVAGLTTPSANTTIGVVTNGGGAIRSVVGTDFTINQGKVLTAQGGDILIYSAAGSVDAGRGAKTSISTPPPSRSPITTDDGVIVGYLYTLAAGAAGSGIQTLTSDPDGVGPRAAPIAGSIFLFAPAGTIDAGEAGIRSGGNIVINAQTVLNATNISSSGSSVGVPIATSGSLAASVATAGTANNSKSAEEAANSANNAARAAAAADGLQKPTILTVEVLGFGDKNCKEQQKDCFAK